MYRSYYQFDLDPFRLTPDSRFAYPHPRFKDVRASMQLALEQWDGILMLTGRPGMGKTTLSEDFQAGCRLRGIPMAAVVASQFEPGEFIYTVARTLGVDVGRFEQTQLFGEIQTLLFAHAGTVLIVDEAQNLSEVALQELLSLSDIQCDSRPSLLVFLIGQENLTQNLRLPSQAPLRQRITLEHCLDCLDLRETCSYLLHRLGRAGWTGNPSFSPEAFILIQRFSLGLPRYLCQLGTRLLTHGAVAGLSHLDAHSVAVILAELKEEMLMPRLDGVVNESVLAATDISKLLDSSGSSLEAILELTQEEREFLAENSGCAVSGPEPQRIVEPQATEEPASLVSAASIAARTIEFPEAPSIPEQLAGASAAQSRGARGYVGYGLLIAAAVVSAYYLAVGRSATPVVSETRQHPGEPPPLGELTSIALEYPVEMIQAATPVAESEQDHPAVIPELQIVDTGLPEEQVSDPVYLQNTIAEVAEAESLPTLNGRPEYSGPQSDASTVNKPALDGLDRPGRDEKVLATRLDQPLLEIPVTSVKERVAELVILGDEALAKNYLTTPEDDSAYLYYQLALDQSPESEVAAQGMQAIARRYGLMATSMIKKEQYRVAGLFIKRGLVVVDNYPELLALDGELERLVALQAESDVIAKKPAAAPRKGLIGVLKRFFAGNDAESG